MASAPLSRRIIVESFSELEPSSHSAAFFRVVIVPTREGRMFIMSCMPFQANMRSATGVSRRTEPQPTGLDGDNCAGRQFVAMAGDGSEACTGLLAHGKAD